MDRGGSTGERKDCLRETGGYEDEAPTSRVPSHRERDEAPATWGKKQTSEWRNWRGLR